MPNLFTSMSSLSVLGNTAQASKAQPAATNTASRLISLPTELLLNICDWTPAGYVALQRTCRTLYQRLPPPKRPLSLNVLLEIERWSFYDGASQNINGAFEAKEVHAWRDYFACSICLRLRPAIHFTDRNLKGPRGKGPGACHANKRKCIACCARNALFDPSAFKVAYGGPDGGYGSWCSECNRFKNHDEFARTVLSMERTPWPRICTFCERKRRVALGSVLLWSVHSIDFRKWKKRCLVSLPFA